MIEEAIKEYPQSLKVSRYLISFVDKWYSCKDREAMKRETSLTFPLHLSAIYLWDVSGLPSDIYYRGNMPCLIYCMRLVYE